MTIKARRPGYVIFISDCGQVEQAYVEVVEVALVERGEELHGAGRRGGLAHAL